ncbi:VOC family protein [Bacillus sp. KH172YL63]|uniref:VOC family protein n=1 Tax=Bacillus sp. KH172YL63 TaxID=2709784 RepID=UPI0013E4230C|nr:VOC family protein [Bacillus sp. KH172YL63]BCB02981.1 metallothiol transferase FosB [Bacillus sp. KH172YL63]
MNITGINHLTINTKSLEKSLPFYLGILKAALIHRGRSDAYLEWGPVWICLQEKSIPGADRDGAVDHIAFTIDEDGFWEAVRTLKENEVELIRTPVKRGKGWSVIFRAPDHIRFELHTSNLKERMDVWR